jgi:hypothetical protein
LVPLFVGACGSNPVGRSEQALDSVGRRIFGPGSEYPATSRDAVELARALDNNMQERRKFGWEVARRTVSLVSVPHLTQPVPAFMTWYTQSEIGAFFQGVLQNLSVERRAEIRDLLACGKAPNLSDSEVRQAMNAAAASSPVNMTEEEFAALLARIAAGDDGRSRQFTSSRRRHVHGSGSASRGRGRRTRTSDKTVRAPFPLRSTTIN